MNAASRWAPGLPTSQFFVSRVCVPQSATIHVSTSEEDAVVSLTVRPWFHVVGDLESLAFAADTPAFLLSLLKSLSHT